MSLSDEAKLLIAVFQQIDPFPKLDYQRLMSDLGLPSVNAAQVRWSRYTTKMKKLRAENEKTGALKIVPGGAKAKKRERDDEDDDGGELGEGAKKKMKMEKGGLETAGKTAVGRKKTSLANSLNATTSKPGGRGKVSKGGGVEMYMEVMDGMDGMDDR
ncbi:hypothetical protein CJF30_00008622 [Rutstroemia sp. NJR-2017a BBW]|nr:hypothetical protein CJF30_00008622 [Rutstroemia sp. NJR-2017a BBW]